MPAAVGAWLGAEVARGLGAAYAYGTIALGFVSLLWNAWRPATPDARRKIQVIAWGTLAGILPPATLDVAQGPRLAGAPTGC